MMAERYTLKNIDQLQNKPVFVDANVLIYLFWPTGSPYWEEQYASIFKNLLDQKNDLYINFQIVSEVVNRIIRIEHRKNNPRQKFKDFRDSQAGGDVLNDTYSIVRNNILNRFDIAGKAFSKQEIDSFLSVDDLDFVDKATISVCKEKGLTLFTNDKDFKNADLDILTGNPAILEHPDEN